MSISKFLFGFLVVMTIAIIGFAALAAPPKDTKAAAKAAPAAQQPTVVKTDAEWRKLLTPAQYDVLRQAGTEAPFSGKYDHFKGDGIFDCAACGQPLFRSDTKFDSGTGWPSFYQPLSPKSVIEKTDQTLGMKRTEVLCARCGGHLGHVFEDGPKPTGLRYCMNSVALKFAPEKAAQAPAGKKQ